ncbi:phosphonate ABC transporter, permease protein PhnE [Hyphobacterium sp. SN044]|uniref:phosphonate ABC transporter, permease protein PhnE n=1 Tax=Hyphobacterium sp. SN044 TaxID=2912575 RepID=UPI001F015A47|nr:phosphonate ABC transporter, permease protein PhnE [Hyphobacterium sp. SN044]MCF8879584.1 phosphonate ABC transporter, permease protein PhnE [Hyphobacterium sp. SN044]
MMTRFLTALVALVTFAGLAAAQDERETIVFGVVATEQSENVLHLWEPFVEDMARDTGFNVELRSATDYAGVIEAMRADQVQVAWLTNASGLEASRRANAEVFAKFIYPDGQLGYRSIIIVPEDSPMQDIEDLLVCDGTVNFGLGDPLSTSGTLVPQAYIFADRGIDPQTCFNQVTSASHEQNLLAVANGQLDAATNNTTNIDRLERARPDVLERVRTIWRSPLIQTDPIMWRTDLSPETKATIQEFFLTYGWRGDAEQRAHEQAVLRELEMGGFLPATNEHFLPIMRLELTRDLAEARSDPDLDEAVRAERIAAIEAEMAELSEREHLVAARDLSADIAMARREMVANPDGPQDQVTNLVTTYLQDSPRPEGRAAQINRRPETGQIGRMMIGLIVGLIVAIGLFVTSKPPKYSPARMPSDRIIDAAIWGGLVGLLVWSFWPAEVFKLPLLAENADRMGEYVAGFARPDFSEAGNYLRQIVVTVQIALWGTFFAVILAIPLGLLGASNIAPFWIRRPVRWVMDGLRAINELVVAAVFVAAVGLGPFAGVLALAFHTAGVLGKLFSEAVEAIEEGPVEGVRATGAGPLNEVTWAVIPQVIPLWASYALYRFESNTRSATILGLIGAGGIGQVLYENIRSFEYGKTAVVIGMIIIAVTLVDMMSQVLRKRLM